MVPLRSLGTMLGYPVTNFGIIVSLKVCFMDNFYSVIRAKDVYGLDNGYDKIEDGILMWVESGECTYCLFVDELLGEQQVVVKPLPNYINTFNIKQHGITGCTILGDGNISVILDVSNLYSAIQ